MTVSATKPRVRFAPSPTGLLHVGNLRPAVLNWLFARRAGGAFMLRLDDTDRERSTDAFADAIRADLNWLGLGWTETARQSDRFARYAEVATKLRTSGRLYPCYETEDELDRRRKRQLARGLPPIYDRASLALTEAERTGLEAEGRRPHWRFRLDNSEARDPGHTAPTLVTWPDLVRGDQSIDLGSLSDPVLIRGDGTPLYTYTSVVDDIDFAISHVIRGEDHVTNTGVQIQIFEALGARPPLFAHHSLLVGADGHGLSKRLGSLSVASLRAAGLEPMAILAYIALIGTSDAIAPHGSLDELAALFDLAKLSRAPARFDPAELHALNARLLHLLPFTAVAGQLDEFGIGGGEAFWLGVRGNLGVLDDARLWWEIVSRPLAPVIEDAAFCAEAARLLPPTPWSADTWGAWTGALKAATGAKGRALFHPLRLALTARETGPDMKSLLALIGRDRALARLGGETA